MLTKQVKIQMSLEKTQGMKKIIDDIIDHFGKTGHNLSEDKHY